MTIKLPFIERIKALSRDLINRDNRALNRPRTYEVEILPSQTHREKPSGSVSNDHVIKSVAPDAALPVRARHDRLWLVHQRGGQYTEHTRSNLG